MLSVQDSGNWQIGIGWRPREAQRSCMVFDISPSSGGAAKDGRNGKRRKKLDCDDEVGNLL